MFEAEREPDFTKRLRQSFLESEEGQAKLVYWAIVQVAKRLGETQPFFCPPGTDFSQANLPEPIKEYLQEDFAQRALPGMPGETQVVIETDFDKALSGREAKLSISTWRKDRPLSTFSIAAGRGRESWIWFDFQPGEPLPRDPKSRKELKEWMKANCYFFITGSKNTKEKLETIMGFLEFVHQQVDQAAEESQR